MDIYGTLGPACSDISVLTNMFRNGMTGARLNLSHSSLMESEAVIEKYRMAASLAGIKNPKLLIDMQGPELRIGEMEPTLLKDRVLLGKIGIPVPEILFSYFRKGQTVLLDDGKLLVEITDVDRDCNNAIGEVKRGGILHSRKSILVEGVHIPVPAITDQDRTNIGLAKDFGVTGIMQPFVRSRDDLITVRNAMDESSCGHLKLLAKVENLDGVKNLPSFFGYADEIVIARGDLGNAMPLWELPGIQKWIASECQKAGSPFMVVTQMLASMEEHSIPTRAEVSDIYNAVLDGAASVMVTGETAIGKYPTEVIKYLSNTAREALKVR